MVLSIQNIEKSYDRPVLKGLSHSFSSGKLYVIKGVSGCGKSTLLNILGGIETHFTGEIHLNGEDHRVKSETLRHLCGYIYQQSLLLSRLTVRDNLLLIRNQPEKVTQLCEEAGITDLLDKQSNELSGGERQRVAIVRALLNDPQILLADEPTASLDDGNSAKIAATIAGLRSQNKILIVATHEHCFDALADEIIDLRYGVISHVHTQGSAEKSASFSSDEADRKPPRAANSFRYHFQRDSQKYRFSATLPYAWIFLLIMLVSTVQHCLSDEYLAFFKQSYPVDAFNVERICFEAAPDSPYKDQIFVYEEYRATDGDVTAFYLADEQDSVLAIDGMLEYGRFPESENEVIVSIGYAQEKMDPSIPIEERIGHTITFCDREFTVSGILYEVDRSINADPGDRNKDFYSYLFSDTYYGSTMEKTNGLFLLIPYETIQTIGTPRYDDSEVRCVYRGLFDDEEAYAAIRDIATLGLPPDSAFVKEFTVNTFEKRISDAQYTVNICTAVIYGILIVCFVIACIFVHSQVQVELFYRKRELGYLQIFGLRKRRIRSLVLGGYLFKIGLSFVWSLAMYTVCLGIYCSVTRRFVIFHPLHVPFLALLILVFYLGTVCISTAKFLRQAPINLITDESKRAVA